MDWFEIKINTDFLIKELHWGKGEKSFSSIRGKIRTRSDRWRTGHGGINTETTKKPQPKTSLEMLEPAQREEGLPKSRVKQHPTLNS